MTSTTERTDDLSKYAGTWTLDPAKTNVRFRTRVFRVLPVKGFATALSGEAEITAEGDARGIFVFDAGSFYTKNKKRDEHLRSADFFDLTRYPTARISTGTDVRIEARAHRKVTS